MYSAKQINSYLDKSKKTFENTGDISLLRDILRFHEYRYYILNDPMISDEEYDKLFKALETMEKKNPKLITPDSPTQRVATDLNKDFVTVRHLAPMLSIENSYNLGDLVAWQDRLFSLLNTKHIHFSVEPKYDGAGLSLIYENDLLVRGATRGDGVEGDDITINIRQIGSIPLSANFLKYGIQKIEIRGESLLNKVNFKKFNEELLQEGIPPLANPRNAAAGSMRMKDPAEVKKRRLEAVLYHVSYIEYVAGEHPRFESHSSMMQLLTELGFKTPGRDQKVFSDIDDVIKYCHHFEEIRDTLPFEIDGMVIKVDDLGLQREVGSTSHHPRWSMAFKFKARQATSKLLNVEFQVGRTGSITPVAKIKPVYIGGVTVSSVSLFNEGLIKEKDLRIGDDVIVERAGDVIPYIVKSLPDARNGSEKIIHFPTHCPVCNDKLVKPQGEAAWRCVNVNCPAQVIERIIHFASKDAMDIQTLGESNIRKFYSLGIITDIPSIYIMDFKRIESLEGFGKKSISNLKTAIEKSKSQPLHRLIFGLGIRYVGLATAKELAANVKDIFQLKDFTIEKLQTLKDIGFKVSESIHGFFHDVHNLKMLEQLRDRGLNTQGEEKKQKDGALSGKTFLFTGTLPTLKRSEAQKLVEDNGGTLLSAVSSHLNYLVAGEEAGSKLEKAEKLKTVNIISEEEFLHLISTTLPSQ